ncbi:FKBP-type peptidyl-prolyl cis-trans isomerase domain-containing protein [Hirsutella rhossiliensis]|uniref:peptidylprolyl isomerase n=1 Tax=Hirsutella rhossiliensis TaxID=111463 RepID=A0A9P8SCR6_9HYPO|nr:FKBP-type peptidyl-prolyl cis-trans isomerase domain-containing protein [Hirsutella rhossiliensis]KAH0957918.1 FKBP-type peptidyl-prolyl cis-trans isomerase domain-containing protein [Hirsutella rhossiliensis]
MKPAVVFAAVVSACASLVAAAAQELKIDVTLPVECDRKTKRGDNVSMHYKGTLADSGKKFDASYDRDQPLSFVLGNGHVIKGGIRWDQGLLNMCIGEKRTLTIPPELGYGQRAMGPIPAGSTLIFETELVAIAGVPKPDKIKTKSVQDKVSDKVASAAAEAASAAKTMLTDSDDVQGHEEL